jgi:hypothetical protein
MPSFAIVSILGCSLDPRLVRDALPFASTTVVTAAGLTTATVTSKAPLVVAASEAQLNSSNSTAQSSFMA